MMITPDKIITIAGLPYSQKRILAQALSQELGYFYVETGLFYRALAYALFQQESVEIQEQEIDNALTQLDFRIDREKKHLVAYYQGAAIPTKVLYNTPLSQWVTSFSQESYVRQKIIFLQRSIYHSLGPLVASGLDAGSVVFPQAFCKIYVQSDLLSRANQYCALYDMLPDQAHLERAQRIIQNLDTKLINQGLVFEPNEQTYRLEVNKVNFEQQLHQSLAQIQSMTF